MNTSARLRRRRCIGLRVAVLFAVVFCVYYRTDWAVFGVIAAGGLIALIAYWRDCRSSAKQRSQTDAHARDSQR
jgi:hypothetical protein